MCAASIAVKMSPLIYLGLPFFLEFGNTGLVPMFVLYMFASSVHDHGTMHCCVQCNGVDMIFESVPLLVNHMDMNCHGKFPLLLLYARCDPLHTCKYNFLGRSMGEHCC